jgi:hypothetical protein
MTALSGLATPRQRVGHKLRHAWAHGTNIGDNPDYHTVSGTPRRAARARPSPSQSTPRGALSALLLSAPSYPRTPRCYSKGRP